MLLDIGIGIFSAILVSKFFSLPLAEVMIALGIAFALLPDLDFLYSVAKHWPRNERAVIKHRDLIHYPLIYLPAGAFLMAFFGIEWVALFLLASIGHFIHDSIGIGWGIPWLWPLTKKNYTFFYRYTAPEKPLPKQMLYRWERVEIDTLIDEYNDRDWLENLYLRLHPIVLTEIIVFVAALLLLWRIALAG